MKKNTVNKPGAAYIPASVPKVVLKAIHSATKRGTTSPYSLSISNYTTKNNKKD